MRSTLALALCLCAACGDALVDGGYRGEPLFTADGRVEVLLDEDLIEGCYAENRSCEDDRDALCDDALRQCLSDVSGVSRPWEDHPERLRLALFWTRDGLDANLSANLNASPNAGFIEQAGQTVGRFPGLFSLSVYRPPSEETLRAASGGGRYGVAVVALYLDDDGDARWIAGRDRLVGGTQRQMLIYSPEGFQDDRLGDYGPGWHRLSFSLDCGTTGLTVGPPTPGPLRLGLTRARAQIEQVLIDFDCDGSYEDTCDDSAVRDLCQTQPDEVLCQICADEDDHDDDAHEEEED